MKLTTKMTMPMIAVFLVGISLFFLVFYFLQTRVMIDNVDTTIAKQIEYLDAKMNQYTQDVKELKAELNEDYLAKARTVAWVIKQNPQIIQSQEQLAQLCQKLDIEEIHVMDEKGVLRWGTVASFYGFDFNSSDQTKPFVEILKNPQFELAQEPTPRGADNMLFQYIGVARLDQAGIVQIGVAPERLVKKLQVVDVKNLTQGISFNQTGYLLVVDTETGMIVSSPEQSQLGQEAIALFQNPMDQYESSFWYKNTEGKLVYVHYKNLGEYLIIGVIAKQSLFTSFWGVFGMFMGMTVGVFTLATLVIFVTLRLSVIKEIRKIIEALMRIGKGDLTTRLVLKSSQEFAEISEGMKEMSDNLKGMIGVTQSSSVTLGRVGEQLEDVVTQTSSSLMQIAVSTQTLATRVEAQIEKVDETQHLADDIYQKVEAIRQNAKESMDSVTMTNQTTREGAQLIEEQVKQMEAVNQKFREVEQMVQTLTGQTVQVDKIIVVIQKIAHQIHLLAINASIEAARAGDVGKGFNVVADEIKKLATSSRNATEQINQIIEHVKQNIETISHKTKEAIGEIKRQEEGVELTHKQFEQLLQVAQTSLIKVKEIEGATDKIYERTKEIADAMKEIKVSSEESGVSGEQINAAVEEQVAINQEIKGMTMELSIMIDKLTAQNSRFIIGDNE